MNYLKFLVLLIFLTSKSVLACSCVESTGTLKGDVQRAYENSKLVVTVKAIKIKMHKGSDPEYPNTKLEKQRVTWKIISVWKGDLREGATITTDTIVMCCMCGVSVKAGSSRILYLAEQESFTVSGCSVGSNIKTRSEQENILKELKN